MPSIHRIAAALTFSLLLTVVAAAQPTAYDIVQSFNFPVGILPKGVTGYNLDESSGQFNAYFNGTCSFSLEGSYQLKYSPTISGKIGKDKLTDLSGVSVKVLFVWLNIVEVRVNGGNLEFSVGIASAEFGLDNFNVCPQCGCGLDCNGLVVDRRTEMLRSKSNNPYLSSV